MVDNVCEEVKVKDLKLVVDAKGGLNLFDQGFDQQLDWDGLVVVEKGFEVMQIDTSYSGVTWVLNQRENQCLQYYWSLLVFSFTKDVKHSEQEDCRCRPD